MKALEPLGGKFSRQNERTSFIVLFLLTALTLSGCSFFQDDSESSPPVARAFDKYLYKEDIADLIALGTSSQDSATFVKSYLESWVRQQMILNKARLNLSEQQVLIQMEKQLEDYRTSLLIYAYQKELVKQKLDTVISEKEIVDYHKKNANNLILKDDIIRARYLKIPKGAPDMKEAREWCKSDDSEDLAALEEYCHQYAKSFLLKDKDWILFENLILELGAAFNDDRGRFQPEELVEMEDSLNLYLVYVLDFMKKDNPAPVEYESKKIRDIILNRRRSELIMKMEANAYQEGLNNNYFDLYE